MEDKCVFATMYQSSGKGQRGNKWISDRGENLLFSILFKPENIASVNQFIISQAVTLGIVNYLKGYGIHAKIKWPNDIYVDDKKICGILIENSIMGDKLSYSIAGIGININQKIFEGVPNPTSLAILTNSDVKYDIRMELDKVLTQIFIQYDRIDTAQESIKDDFLNLMYQKDAFHRYIDRIEGVEFEGKITGIDRSSCLLVESRDGRIRRFAFKEIAYVSESK